MHKTIIAAVIVAGTAGGAYAQGGHRGGHAGRKLAVEVIKAQETEIAQMRAILKRKGARSRPLAQL